MNVEEFESRVMARLDDIESMGTPKRHVIGQDVILIYPMTDNFDIIAVTTDGKLRRAVITVP